MYFINIAIDTAVILLGVYGVLGRYPSFKYDFALQLAYSIATIVNFLIELSMLMYVWLIEILFNFNNFSYHPFLRRDFYRLWRSIACKFGNTISPSNDVEGRRESALALRNMHGKRLILNANEEGEEHFNHLQNAWGVGAIRHKMSL